MKKTPNQIFQEFLKARIDGKEITPEELINRYPEHKAFLLKKIAAMELMPSSDGMPQTKDLYGSIIGDFRIIKEIGQGGMGNVYLAEQLSLNRKVALKIIHPSVFIDKKLIDRFRREGRTIAKLQHKGIVPVHVVGEHEGSFYIAMRHIEGLPLSKLIDYAKGKGLKSLEPAKVKDLIARELPSDERADAKAPPGRKWTEMACSIIANVAEAVEYAHRHKILHRDIKPSNIVLTKDGQPVLLDFGLSKDLSAVDVTMTGELLGTPAYSAPEQLFSKRPSPDIRSDVYSLGMTLYELLTFNLPYEGDSFGDMISSLKSKDPVPPGDIEDTISGELDSIILKAISKDPKQRYKNVTEFKDELKQFVNLPPDEIEEPSLSRKAARFLSRRRRRRLIGKKVRCEKCGHVSNDIEETCSKCGEYLYPFYQKQRHKSRMKVIYLSMGIFLVAAAVIAFIYFQLRDPLKQGLIKYFKKIESTNQLFIDSNIISITTNYEKLSEQTDEIAGSKSRYKKSKYDKAFVEFRIYTMKALSDNKYSAYLRVNPSNPEVRDIHGHLLEAYKAASDAYGCFTEGMRLGTITNVKIEKDGFIKWNITRYGKDNSACFQREMKVHQDQYAGFTNKMIPLVERKELHAEYDAAFPAELEVRYIVDNYADYIISFDSSGYKSATIHDMQMERETEQVTGPAVKATFDMGYATFSTKVTYLGDTRPLSGHNREMFSSLDKTSSTIDWLTIYRHEIHVKDSDDRTYWIPIQETLLPAFEQECKGNCRLILYLVWRGSFEQIPFVTAREFKVLN